MQTRTIARSVVNPLAALALAAWLAGPAWAAATAPAASATPAPAAQPAAPAPAANALATAAQAPAEPPVALKQLQQEKLANAPGNSLTAVEVELAPGGSVEPHHHAGFVFAYVISGKIKSQLNKDQSRTYRAGQTWTEPPGTLHTMFQNASRKKRARLLAVFVAPDGAELTTIAK